jgi:5-formyltetrahydrofolate cyclo-ligase
LRDQLLRRRRQLDEATRQTASQSVCQTLAARREVLDADHLAGYVAFDGEVDVGPLVERHLTEGGRLSLPKVENDRKMHFVPVDDLDGLREGAFGIREPVGRPGDVAKIDVFLVPGVGFDRAGGRLGMGWGYYYRILQRRLEARAPAPLLIGVAYDCQLVDHVPTDDHDVPVDAVVTEREWVECGDD